ncbi:MAG: hypothetical protein CL484_03615 [Acidobacteria bacterium]|nr:hypothetical protein [Acidobacteriota bacterium]
MARPIVALISDFGSRDHYAGSMKGVILGICPEVSLVDISHHIPPHDIYSGSLELAAARQAFPAGSIFVAVVDPGVGSQRRGIAAEAGSQYFVAPDNGLLSGVFRETPPRQVVELVETRYFGQTLSRTFEGRDRFAPVAAWLATGVQLSRLGPRIADYTTLKMPKPEVSGSRLEGAVSKIDCFGNVVTNIDRVMFERFAESGAVEMLIGGQAVKRLVNTYTDIGKSEICALFGSTDHLEIAANGASAGDRLCVRRGTVVKVVRR